MTRERLYCTTCGGRPHADGQELAGPPGHPMTWGRLGLTSLTLAVEEEEAPAEPEPARIISLALPADAPRNAIWLSKVPAISSRIVESIGTWKKSEVHILGMAGICRDDVRFLSQWRKRSDGWKSDAHWLRSPDHTGPATWNDVRRVLDGLGGK